MKLKIGVDFAFKDHNDNTVVGTVKGLEADWDGLCDRYDFAYDSAYEYLERVILMDFEIDFLIALTEEELERIKLTKPYESG